ncbi:hypothetical protein [Parafrankia elaeagni]|uniref:hypothetical protein n=1 Tax=Parafrankia elaeagni TaxID=222534 RepID=UPI000372A95F|nr:hypothetical protein [Parafrankia elaeagni]
MLLPYSSSYGRGITGGREGSGQDKEGDSGPYFTGTTLFTQAGGRNQLVADLRGVLGERRVTTDNLPEIDGAPGGTLDSFGILADALKDACARPRPRTH